MAAAAAAKAKAKAKAKKIAGFESKPCFFKIIFPSDHLSRCLKIPHAFHQYLQNEPLEKIALKGPSGNIWHTKLVARSKELYFEHGWEEFVNDHFIEAGDFLVFRYDDRSQFSVAVFSPTACEKESAFVAYPGHTVVVIEQEDNNGENIAAVRNSNMSILLPGESVETQSKKIRVDDHKKLRGHSSGNAALGTPKVTTSTDCVNLKEDEDENMAAVDNSKMLVLPPGESVGTKRKNVITLGNASLGAPKVITSIGCENLKVVGKSQRIPKIISTRRPVTEEEKEKTLRSAKEFTSDKPFFLLKMTAAYVYDGLFLHIPRKFSREYLSKMNSKMTLWNPDGNQWKVNYCYSSKSKNANFYGGWSTFLKENHLEEDDVCVFELIQETQMKVHIYRVVPEVSPPILQSSKK